MKPILMVLLFLAASRPLTAQSPADGEKGGQPFLEIGMSCSTGDICAPGGFCDLKESYCRCSPSTMACDSSCVDAANDPENCGLCGIKCGSGAICEQGMCSDRIATELRSSNANVVGGNVAATNCVNESEAVASPVPLNNEAVMFSAHGTNQTSTALGAWNNWNYNPGSGAAYNIPQSAAMSSINGDSWTTYSTQNNRVYVGMIGTRTNGTGCHAFATTAPTNLDTNTWTSPFACAVGNAESRDQPGIVFNNGTRDLYGAANDAANGRLAVDFYPNCQGQPGTRGCPRTATALVNVGVDPAGFVPALRFGLAINRCTDHLAVAHWENDDLVLRFFTRTGASTGAKFYFDKNRGWGVNPGCGNGVIRRCGLGTPDCKNANATNDACLRMNGKPSISIRQRADGQCYAAIAYDIRESNRYFKSRLALVRVTNESAPVLAKSYQSGSGSAWNDYLSVATTTLVNDNIGWFWQTDRDGACQVRMIGATDTNLGLVSMGGGQIIAGPYEAIRFGSMSGMNDYNAATAGPAGALYPTWGEPVPTSCVNPEATPMCQGVRYNLRAKISQVQP